MEAKNESKKFSVHCRFQSQLAELEVSVFQVANCHSPVLMVPQVIFEIFALSDPKKAQDDCPKSIGIWPDPRQLWVQTFKLIVQEPFECPSGKQI